MHFVSGAIKYDSVAVNGEFTQLTLTIPSTLLPSVQSLLDSLFSFASFVNAKSRHARAASSKDFLEDLEQRSAAFRAKVLTEFNKHYTGSNFRQAVSATKQAFVDRGFSITCGLIEQIIKQERKK